jgi:hypothetical protein
MTLASKQDLVADGGQALSELRKFKVMATDGDVIDAAFCDRLDGGIDLRNLGLAQPVGEIAGVSKISASPGGRILDDLHRHDRPARRFGLGGMIEHGGIVP